MTNSKKDKVKVLSSNLFPVVGIGASAGGLDAFKRLIKAIPEDSGMAYILVQHLDPAHVSILSDLMQRITKIPVQEITDNLHVVPDHIYIIPSNKLLTASDGVLQLSARLPKNHRNLPIDLFFSSLAEVHQSHAIGVVLSGTATDGTLGLKAIKNRGGITFAQEPKSAGYEGMPQSAIAAGIVDFILTPEKIAQKLVLLNGISKGGKHNEEGDEEQVQDAGFKQILSMLRIRRGTDFTYYKQTTIRRRIHRRIALSMKGNITNYLAYLNTNGEELDILFQDLLIPVTQFFRDPAVFDTLSEKVFPTLLKDRGNKTLRVWVAGCSTGEEAYSMVMSFQEYIADKSFNVTMQLFATDISELAIHKARTGIYTNNELTGLSTKRIQQFFTNVDGKFQLKKVIRDACVFANHNYLKDPPFAKIDIISCRNSLIYLESFLQKKALTTFHYSLGENGFLILGKSETVGQAPEFYNTFDKVNKFYTRKAAKANYLHATGDRNEKIKTDSNRSVRSDCLKDDFQKSGDDLLMSKYVPPGVTVNEEMEIVQFRGATGMWLESPPGKPSTNLLKMAREGLAFEIRNALHKAKKGKDAVKKENIPIRFAGKDRLVTIEVVPLPNTIEFYFLVLFTDTTLPVGPAKQQNKKNPDQDIPDSRYSRERLRSENFKNELAQAREDMRSVTEDQEAANEELQSANEELLSGSEELQSLNEELETSKEEVQTSNEELIIVNQELYDRNEQLNLSRLYAESVVATIRQPLVILDKELKVKSANKAFYEKFSVNEEDTRDKLLFAFGNGHWEQSELQRALENVLPGKINIVDFEIRGDFPILGERVMLLNASRIIRDHSEEQSILVAIEDVTEKRRKDKEEKGLAEELERKVFERTMSLNQANVQLQLSNENLSQFAYIASHDLQEPLRKIRTFSSILRDKHISELSYPVRGLVSKISSSSERMSALISDVISFSRAVNSDGAFKQTDLDHALTKVISEFDLLIEEKSVTIYREPLPVIDAIPFQINQLFYNLINNAIKFSKNGIPPVITITSKLLRLEEMAKFPSLDPEFAYCEIAIKDNGIGFNPDMKDKIFLIFQRLHSQQEYSGTGIGLALCKKIVANHHGEISATSKRDEGAIFKILLPLEQQ